MSPDTFVLGISMSNHDRAACLLKNGQVVGAIAEERLDRRKRSEGFYGFAPRSLVLPPMRAIAYVLRQGGIGLDAVDLVVGGRSMRLCRDELLACLPVDPERVVEPQLPSHHLAHAYSAYAVAPFPAAAVLVIDEQGHHLPDGRFEKCAWFEGEAGPLRPLAAFMGGGDDLSLGMFYNAFGAMTSLSEAGKPAAGKLMGLAPYGRPRPEWPALIDFDLATGDTRISLSRLDAFMAQAGLAIRPGLEGFAAARLDDLLIKYAPVSWRTPLGADLARKAQDELEAAVLHISRALRSRAGAAALAYAGGVALNCSTNRRLRETGWDDVFVQPAATDDGNALGLAYYGWLQVLGQPRHAPRFFSPFTGRRYAAPEIAAALDAFGLRPYAATLAAPAEAAAERLAQGEIICWFEGGSEWGPRALGARSIVANPLLPGIRDRLNSTIKYREAFRPFAVSGTAAGLAQMLDLAPLPASLGPYMLAAGEAADPRLNEVRHVDGSLRFQIVDPETQPAWHALIVAFGARTGVEVVLNTSFNTFGEPLVESPKDALRQYLLAGADALIIEGHILARASVPAEVWDAARRRAWADMDAEPLGTALGLEAAGYREAALNVLELSGYDEETARARGLTPLRGYHSLMHRAALERGDASTAGQHADAILRLSGLPMEALEAADYLAQEGDARQKSIGRLARAIAGPGDAYHFFGTLPGG